MKDTVIGDEGVLSIKVFIIYKILKCNRQSGHEAIKNACMYIYSVGTWICSILI